MASYRGRPSAHILIVATLLVGLCACKSPRSRIHMNEVIDTAGDEVGDGMIVGGSAVSPTPTPEELTYALPTPNVFRLTQAQYLNTLRAVFGETINLRLSLEPDQEVEGFVSVGAGVASTSPRGVELYEEAAYRVAEQVIEDGWRIYAADGCEESGGCFEELANRLGRRLWRRPLVEEERRRLVNLAFQVSDVTSSEDEGARYLIAALLQSPDFLFRVERGEPRSEAPRPVTSWELASRLSFMLWAEGPDDELLDTAEDGSLADPEVLAEQADRMMNDPRFKRGVRQFFTEYLGLAKLKSMRKDPAVFPHARPELTSSAKTETLALVERLLVDEAADLRSLFVTRLAYVDRLLASIYEVPAPQADGFGWVEFPEDSPRRGLLGQVSFLALYAHPVSTSATHRGMMVRQRMLCGTIPPPPANVDTSIPEPSPELPTLRERIRVHLEVDSCATCHSLVDPIGLGLERFDGVGRFRAIESGAEIDPSGALDGADFADARELGERIIEHPKWASCLVSTFARFVFSREDRVLDRENLEGLTAWWSGEGFPLRPLLRALILSPAFLSLADEEEEL